MTSPDAGDPIARKLIDCIRMLLRRDDVQIDPDAQLGEQTGLDSIDAFNLVATLHELMGVPIPDDFRPEAVMTVNRLSAYLRENYPQDALDKFLHADLSRLAADADEL